MQTALIVEDSIEYQIVLKNLLREFEITVCENLRVAIQTLRSEVFDLAIVDINLPDGNGYSLLSEFASVAPNTAFFCISARVEITDKITAFSLGAWDYLTKPFNPLELKARIDARLKRVSGVGSLSQLIRIGDVEIDVDRHRIAIVEGEKREDIDVTQTEFKLLKTLAARPGQVYSRDQLLVAVWGEDARVLDRAVDVHLCSLRKKLGRYAGYIKAVTGVGYQLRINEIARG